MKRSRIILTLVLMTLLSSLSYIYYYHAGWGVKDARYTKHIVYLLHLLVVFALGNYALKGGFAWLSKVWQFFYVAVIALLLLAALYESVYQKLPFSWYESLAGLRFYFQTPIPFLVFLLIARQVSTAKQNQQKL